MIELEPAFFAIEGQLRFYSEETLESELDDIGIRVNGVDFFDF